MTRLVLTLIFVLALFSLALAQEDPAPPDWLGDLLSQKLMGMVTATIAASKVFRNMLGNVKGAPAFVLTMAVSLVVGEFTFYSSHGWLLAGLAGLFAGLVSTGVFKGGKIFGKKVGKLQLGQ